MPRSMIAASTTQRVMGPIWSSDSPKGKTPERLTLPYVGLTPTMPQAAEGKRIDPPVSDPSEPKHKEAAVAAPEPLDEAPGQRSGFQGFTGGCTLGWYPPSANSVMPSLPSRTAPAALSFS